MHKEKIKKAQILLAVLVFMFVVSALVWGAAGMFRSEIRIMPLYEFRAAALYLAQAGVEQAKIDVLADVDTEYGPEPDPYWSDDLDDGTDNFIYQYKYEITDLGSGERGITGFGQVLDANDNILAERRIYIELEDIVDLYDSGSPQISGSPDKKDDDEEAIVKYYSWKEI